jgi:hypothetical protein
VSQEREFTGGMWVFGQIIDRYATDGYNDPPAALDIIEQAAASGLTGLDLNYPWPETDLTPEAELADESVDVAARMGARYVKFWPGQDGYDYPFQVDYALLREHGLGGIRDVACNHPDTTFAIEYKPRSPRTRLLWSTAAATLVNSEDTGVDDLGVVIDLGTRCSPRRTRPRPCTSSTPTAGSSTSSATTTTASGTTTSPPAPYTSSRPSVATTPWSSSPSCAKRSSASANSTR